MKAGPRPMLRRDPDEERFAVQNAVGAEPGAIATPGRLVVIFVERSNRMVVDGARVDARRILVGRLQRVLVAVFGPVPCFKCLRAVCQSSHASAKRLFSVGGIMSGR